MENIYYTLRNKILSLRKWAVKNNSAVITAGLRYTDFIAGLELPYTKGVKVNDDGTVVHDSMVVIPEGEWAIVRVDGHCFSRYTRRFRKVSPFHPVISGAMDAAAKALLSEFQGVLVYTQSDEITLVIPPNRMQYGGRTCKLASLSAAVATGAFRRYVDEADRSLMPDAEPEKCNALFDGRAYGVSKEMAAATVWYRQRSGIKNSISCFANTKYSHSQLNAKNSDERISMMLDKGEDWYSLPYRDRLGAFFVSSPETVKVDIEERRRAGANEHEIANLEKAGGLQTRNVIRNIEYPELGLVSNLAGMLFDKEEPIIKQPKAVCHENN